MPGSTWTPRGPAHSGARSWMSGIRADHLLSSRDPPAGGSGARLRIDRRGGGLGHGSEVRKKMGRQAPDRPGGQAPRG
jgi:hypothetical protein